MRWIAFAAAIALIVLAFAAATQVADTREGLIAEIITLLAGATGLGLGTYAFAARKRPAARTTPPAPATTAPRERTTRDIALGAAGIGLSIVLVSGLAISGGPMWAVLGFLLLLPMLAGSVYLCWRFLRASAQD